MSPAVDALQQAFDAWRNWRAWWASQRSRFREAAIILNGPLLGYELFRSRIPVGGAQLATPIVAAACALQASAGTPSGRCPRCSTQVPGRQEKGYLKAVVPHSAGRA